MPYVVHSSRSPVVAAGILSMHHSGYVREAALRELAVDRSAALVFVVSRCPDWVPQVQGLATDIFRRRISDASKLAVMLSLPIADRLAAQRAPRARAMQEVRTGLARRLSTSDLLDGIDHYDLRVRQSCARVLVEDGTEGRALTTALRQPDPITASIIGNAVLAAASDTASAATLWAMFESRHTKLAVGSAAQLISRADDRTAIATPMLLDRRKAVRTVAQHAARREGLELVAFYRGHLGAETVAVSGLCEIATREHVGLVVPFLDDPRPRVRESAVSCVGRLDPDAFLDILRTALRDPSPRVARAAGRGLVNRDDEDTVAAIVDCLVNEAPTSASFTSARYLARRLRKWARLRVALSCCGATNEFLQSLGVEILDSTLERWNQTFASPTARERDDIANALRRSGSDIPGTLRERLVFLLAADGIVP